jgi:hypothetical protein
MSLIAGTRLGPYEIVSPLGVGGMGEVYKARDTRLGRDVAIKVLPASFAADADRLRRFEQEARTVGSLNHPNLVTLLDVGSHDGSPFLVMELLDGDTLRQKLTGKPLPVRRAAEIARGVAEGLSAAHDKGVIHRDLKPENVFLTRDARVKILDFGLAKLRSGSGPQEAVSDDQPTGMAGQRAVATDAGLVLGTVGYMSPEKGPSAVESMNAILKDEPPDLDPTLKLPPVLERIVHTCLAKDPAARFHSAHALAFALENLSSGSQASIAIAPHRRKTGWMWAALAAVLLVGVGLAVGARTWGRTGAPLALPSFHKLTFGRGAIDGARFVPGSRDIVYSARWQGNPSTVYLLREGSVEPRALEPPGAMLIGTSAQGSAAVLTRPTLFNAMFAGTVSVLPLAGGGAREISGAALAADFTEDGSGLCLVTLSGSSLFQLEWPKGEILLRPTTSVLRAPRVHGTQVAFFQSTPATFADGELRVMAKGEQPRTLARCKGFTSLAWGPDGEEIWFSTFDGGESQVQAVSLKGRTRLLMRHAGHVELVDVDPTGRCLAVASSQLRQAFGRAPGADREVDLTWLDAQTPNGLRADGSQVLLARWGDWEMSAHAGLYLRPLDGGPAINIGSGSQAADLSPDGRWAATLETDAKGQAGLRLIPTGPGASRWFPLTGAAANADVFWFHPQENGGYLLDEDAARISRIDLTTGTITLAALPARIGISSGLSPLSPDGRRMLLVDELPSTPLDNTLIPYLLFDGEGSQPRAVKGIQGTEVVAGWADDNREVFVYERNAIPATVVRLNPETGARRPFLQITPSDPSGVWGIRNLQVTPSGSAYTYSVIRKLSDLYVIEGLK